MSRNFGNQFSQFQGKTLEQVFASYNFLGYDNGDGELACSIVKYDADENKLEAHPLTFSPASYELLHVPNILAFEDGKAVLVNQTPDNGQHIYHNFKRCPGPEADQKYRHHGGEIDEKTYADLMGHSFACALSQLFLCNNNRGNYWGINTELPTIVLVGHPADQCWTGSEKQYVEILKRHLKRYVPEQADMITILTLSESNAAMAGAVGLQQENWLNMITQILDIGSSTTDITTVTPGGIPDGGEDSYAFGGNRLDEALADYGDYYVTQMYSGKNVELRKAPCKVVNLRLKKEEYYGDNGRDVNKDRSPISYGYTVHIQNTNKNEYQSFPLVAETMQTVLENPKNLEVLHCRARQLSYGENTDCQSWLAGFRYILEQFHERTKQFYTPGVPRRLILTGGVSNMPEVREIAKEVFQPDEVEDGGPPSLTVSVGLARILGNEIIKRVLLGELEGEIEAYFKQEELTRHLQNCLVDAACDADLGDYERVIEDWVRLPGNRTLSECIEKLKDPNNGFFDPNANFVKTASANWFTNFVAEHVRKMLQDKFKDLFPSFPGEFQWEVETPDFNGLPVVELKNQFGVDMNPYMFFDERNCPQNPFDVDAVYRNAVYNQEERQRMLEVFRNHRKGLKYRAELTYPSGHNVRVRKFKNVRTGVRYVDLTHVDVASISSIYMPQIEQGVKEIRDRVFQKLKPQIENFVESLTYYLAIR